jgi:hypothetical protein
MSQQKPADMALRTPCGTMMLSGTLYNKHHGKIHRHCYSISTSGQETGRQPKRLATQPRCLLISSVPPRRLIPATVPGFDRACICAHLRPWYLQGLAAELPAVAVTQRRQHHPSFHTLRRTHQDGVTSSRRLRRNDSQQPAAPISSRRPQWTGRRRASRGGCTPAGPSGTAAPPPRLLGSARCRVRVQPTCRTGVLQVPCLGSCHQSHVSHHGLQAHENGTSCRRLIHQCNSGLPAHNCGYRDRNS